MQRAKYIIVIERGHEVPIVFSSLIEHAVIGSGHEVVSAGFCEANGIEQTDESLDTLSVWAGGRSVTLKDDNDNYVASRGEVDAALIKKMLEDG